MVYFYKNAQFGHNAQALHPGKVGIVTEFLSNLLGLRCVRQRGQRLLRFDDFRDFGLFRIEIGRVHRTRRQMAWIFPIGVHDAEVMLGMLIKILGSDTVARGCRLAGEGHVSLEDLIGVAANFYAGTIAVKGLRAMGGSWTTAGRTHGRTWGAAVIGIAAAAARPFIGT